MNELKIFEHPKFGNIRTVTEDGRTLFCGKDVAAALGYKRPNDAISTHCRGTAKRRITDKSGWKGTQTLITPKGRETFRLLFVGAA